MNILYIHQYFKTPEQPGGTRSYWFARELVNRGHNVTMITSKSSQSENVINKKVDGINVFYLKNPYKFSMGVFRRMISFVRFAFKSSRFALKQKKIDLVIATSTPLTVGIPALLCKWMKGVNYVFEVRDLWPEVPIQMGGMTNPIMCRIAKGLEKKIYKNAKHIIALSPGMKKGVTETGIPKEKVSMIPNMSKVDKFWRREKNVDAANNYGISLNKFNVIHFGAMGLANGLEYMIDAAEISQKNSENDICYILLGDGSQKDKLLNEAEKRKLRNVKFIPRQPMDVVSEIVNLCDASFVPFKNLPVLWTNSPNKLFDSLSAGIPIIVNSPGWTKDMVKKNKCGAYVNPEKPQELVDLLCNWKNNPQLVKKMGDASRNLAETVYDKSILCRKFIEVINSKI